VQHTIYDQNRNARARHSQPVVNCLRELHGMAARLQFEPNLLGEVALVFDEEHRGAPYRLRRADSLKRQNSHRFTPDGLAPASLFYQEHGATMVRTSWRPEALSSERVPRSSNCQTGANADVRLG